jgi:hypothetical protein
MCIRGELVIPLLQREELRLSLFFSTIRSLLITLSIPSAIMHKPVYGNVDINQNPNQNGKSNPNPKGLLNNQ